MAPGVWIAEWDHTMGIGLVLADKLLDYIVNATPLYVSSPARH